MRALHFGSWSGSSKKTTRTFWDVTIDFKRIEMYKFCGNSWCRLRLLPFERTSRTRLEATQRLTFAYDSRHVYLYIYRQLYYTYVDMICNITWCSVIALSQTFVQPSQESSHSDISDVCPRLMLVDFLGAGPNASRMQIQLGRGWRGRWRIIQGWA